MLAWTIRYDALAGSKSALLRLMSVGGREHMISIAKGHARHIAALVVVVREMDVVPWTAKDVSLVFTKAKVVFAARGGDDAILRAIRDSERGLVAAYALMLARALPAALRTLLSAHQADALRTYDGLERRVHKPPPESGILLRFPARTTGQRHVSLEEKR